MLRHYKKNFKCFFSLIKCIILKKKKKPEKPYMCVIH